MTLLTPIELCAHLKISRSSLHRLRKRGLPAISIPCGLSSKGLPIGLQFMGRPFEENIVLRAAYAYEQATNWQSKRPVIRS